MSKDTNKLICLGMVFPKGEDNFKIHQRNWVYSIKGICPTQTSTQYKDPPRIMVRCKK